MVELVLEWSCNTWSYVFLMLQIYLAWNVTFSIFYPVELACGTRLFYFGIVQSTKKRIKPSFWIAALPRMLEHYIMFDVDNWVVLDIVKETKLVVHDLMLCQPMMLLSYHVADSVTSKRREVWFSNTFGRSSDFILGGKGLLGSIICNSKLAILLQPRKLLVFLPFAYIVVIIYLINQSVVRHILWQFKSNK